MGGWSGGSDEIIVVDYCECKERLKWLLARVARMRSGMDEEEDVGDAGCSFKRARVQLAVVVLVSLSGCFQSYAVSSKRASEPFKARSERGKASSSELPSGQ